MGTSNFYFPDKLMQQYQKTIQVPEDEVVLLKSLLK